MAESILRLKVESQEYDNKLKRAAEGLTRYAEQCRKAGGTLQYVDDGVLEFTRSLGKMDTVATTTRGKLAELTKTYTELSAQYRKMTDEEKQGEYGKALAASLDQLRGRIQSSKQELDEINQSINGGGGLTGSLDALAGKFGLSIKQLTGWGAAIAAAKGALDVAKDAFFASESTVDEWGRVMDSSKSLYEGFLTALNTGDISGYLSRIDEIVSAARTAYNELDRLGTMKTIQAPRISAQQTENERMRMMIQTGRYIAPVDGRRAAMADGQKLTKEQIQRIEKQLQNGMKSVVGLVSNEVKQTGRAIDAVYKRQAAELGMDLNEFRRGTSSMAEFDKRIRGAENYQRYEREHTTYDERSGVSHRDRTTNPFEQFAKWSTFRVDGQRYNDLVKLIQQRDQQAAQAYSMQGQTYRTMNRAEGVTVRSIMNGGTGGSGGGTTSPVPVEIKNFDPSAAALAATKGVDTMPSVFGMLKDSGAVGINGAMGSISPDLSAEIEKQTALVDELREKWAKAGGELRDSYITQIIEAEDKLRNLQDSRSIGTSTQQWDAKQDVSKQWKVGKNGQLTNKPNGKEDKDEKTAEEQLQGTQTMISSLQSIVTGIDQLGIQLPKELTNIFGVLQTITGIVGAIQTMQTVGTFLGIFHNGGIVPHAANGYYVPGNSYSGDTTPILANAGELILNKSSQSTLAAQLQNRDSQQSTGAPYITGEMIFLGLNNYLKSTGRGEMMTSRFKG